MPGNVEIPGGVPAEPYARECAVQPAAREVIVGAGGNVSTEDLLEGSADKIAGKYRRQRATNERAGEAQSEPGAKGCFGRVAASDAAQLCPQAGAGALW